MMPSAQTAAETTATAPNASDTPLIDLPAVLDLPAAAVLADRLRAACGSVILDGGAVERIGAAGLQMLLSARLTAMAAGHALVIERASAALTAAAAIAGAGALLSPPR